MCRAEHAKAVDKTIFPGIQGGPLVHVIAAKAVAFKEALTEEFRQYQRRVVENADTLARGLMERGMRIISGGTDNHLMLVDLSATNVTGKDAEETLDLAGITVNKNAIPYDEKPPTVTSGIRLGTPCVTTRGFGSSEMREVADMISAVIHKGNSQATMNEVRERVIALCERYPLYAQ